MLRTGTHPREQNPQTAFQGTRDSLFFHSVNYDETFFILLTMMRSGWKIQTNFFMVDEINFFKKKKGKQILSFITSKVLENTLDKSKIEKHLQIKKPQTNTKI